MHFQFIKPCMNESTVNGYISTGVCMCGRVGWKNALLKICINHKVFRFYISGLLLAYAYISSCSSLLKYQMGDVITILNFYIRFFLVLLSPNSIVGICICAIE